MIWECECAEFGENRVQQATQSGSNNAPGHGVLLVTHSIEAVDLTAQTNSSIFRLIDEAGSGKESLWCILYAWFGYSLFH